MRLDVRSKAKMFYKRCPRQDLYPDPVVVSEAIGVSFHLFLSFQTNITIFTTNICLKNVHPVYSAGIWTHKLQNTSLLQ